KQRDNLGVLFANPCFQGADGLFDVRREQFVGEFEAEGHNNVLGRKMCRNDAVRPFDAVLILGQGDNRLRERSLWACSPMSNPLLSRTKPHPTIASTRPTSADAIPSATGKLKLVATYVPAIATAMPTSPAVSSARTMKLGGSLLVFIACQ